MKIAIIGAGPAGIYTTLLLKNFKGEVYLFEQNKFIGEKLKLTGGGRMNITNKQFFADHFSSSQPRLLNNMFKSPWIQKREEIFKELGTEYVWEKDRAILKSQNALQEVKRLAREIDIQKNSTIHTETSVKEIKKNDDGTFNIEYHVRNNDRCSLQADIVIIASGGMFRIKDPGAVKHIYALAKFLGHTITNLQPSLSPILINKNPLVKFAGTTFTGTLFDPSSKKSVTNDILITHQGLSGPAVLDFSSYLQDNCFEIAFTDKISEEAFGEKMKELRNGSHRLRQFLQTILPKKLADFGLQKNGLDVEIRVADLNKQKIQELQKTLFHFPISGASHMGYTHCWTTQGGVDLSEVNVATLESKLHKNLFFAGEVLDVNGLCGGYNISFAAICAKLISELIFKGL